jgi:hypothetical protein
MPTIKLGEKEMASNVDDRGRFLTTGGVLSIVVGVFMMYVGVSSFFNYHVSNISLLFPLLPSFGLALRNLTDLDPTDLALWNMIEIGFFIVLGIIAIAGGISAIRKKRFGLSLAGAICALPSGILGILAVIFVSLARGEFGAKE